MKTNQKFNLKKQDILSGSRVLKSNQTKNRIDYIIENVDESYLVKNNILDKKNFIEKFKNYRKAWNEQPKEAINDFVNKSEVNDYELDDSFKPLCVDLELASICDLACPHCFREYFATPDKIKNAISK